jgi:alpha-tubulin suppressor-like RCC1 family protein
MSRGPALLGAALLAAACLGTEPLPVVPGVDVSGRWNYTLNVLAGPEDQCFNTGVIEFTQSGTTVTGTAQTYTGSCLPLAGAFSSATASDTTLTVHAGGCTLTAVLQSGTPDTLSGPATCVNTFGTWTGHWNAGRTGIAASVQLVLRTSGIVLGASHLVQAIVRDAAGHVLYGLPVTWSTSNSAVATITPQAGTLAFAQLTGASAGSAQIIASAPAPEIQVFATESVTVASPTFTQIEAGTYATCGRTVTGDVWCWGMTDFTNLSAGAVASSPVRLSTTPSFSQISVGGTQVCGVTGSGAAYCLGQNHYGQLGTGDTVSSTSFRAVAGGVAFARVSAGYTSTCGVSTANAAYCWGSSATGTLGTGDSLDAHVPKAVAGLATVLDLDTWSDHTCAVTTANAAYCWGSNSWGELGNGSTSNGPVRSPQPVSGGLAFTSVTAGGIHTCGIAAFAVYCWGNGASGEVPNGTYTVTNSAPVAASGGLSVASLKSSFDFSCALAAGAAYCWGTNTLGQLGIGSTSPTKSNVPLAVSGGLSFTQITLGGSHACGLTQQGAVWCWGYNLYGEVGDGTTTTRTAPVKVFGQP